MTTEDRRAPGVPRISFDGLVEIGGELGPTFEAHAVNVSEEGMQLRTPYLPELGQQITCRFETAPNEGVVGSGEVVWCRTAEKGGQFGVRFTDIDPDSVEALKRVCGLASNGVPPPPGAKVRLYIDGLASPMRAKIRDACPTAVTVGSDLSFLQVGRQLDLEDAQSGAKRAATIQNVEVSVDANSRVPQLIVTLQYTEASAAAQAPATPERPADDRPATTASDAHEMGGSEGATGFDEDSKRFRSGFATKVTQVGPAFQRLARRARVTFALLAKRRRDEDDTAPRRTTAPPPAGGLRSSGRRVVRDGAGASGDAMPPRRGTSATGDDPARLGRWTRGRIGLAAGVLGVIVTATVALKRAHHETPAAAVTPAVELPAVAPSANSMAVASPPAPSAIAGTQEATPATPMGSASGPEALRASSDSLDTPGTSIDGAKGEAKKHARVAPFANGPVHHGNVMRLRMDGPIDAIEGAQEPTGFTVKIPGRKSLEAAGPLADRDSRIATIKVNNEAAGAQLTVAFKDGVPNYRVSARGSSLVIALAPMGALETTVAKREDPAASPKHGSRAHDATPER